jgi:hypothetical protein
MASKGKREPKPQAGPGVFVDLNLWDVLLGLMEPGDKAEMVGRDPMPDEAGPVAASEAEREDAGEKVRAAGRKENQGSRRERRRENGSGSEG